MSLVYLNGAILPEGEAHISVRDRGFLRGDSIFETMPVYNGHVFLLSRRLERLERSAELIYLPLPMGRQGFTDAVRLTVSANRACDAGLRLTVSRGVGPGDIDPLEDTKPTVAIVISPLKDYTSVWRDGVDVVISDVRKQSPDAIPGDAKTGNYLNSVLARRAAHEAGAFEAILLNPDGTVAEGAISNVFAVADGVARTPPLDGRILPGITRGAVLDLCAELGIPAEETALRADDLRAADEVWLTSSLTTIARVKSLDGAALGGDAPVHRAVRGAYWEWVRRECDGATPPYSWESTRP